jgi:hypothetical protein
MNAVLNVAKDGWYPRGARRLAESLDSFAEPTERLFLTEWPDRSHQQVPYGFKPDVFRLARERGFDRAIWIDASCWLVRPLDEAWAQLERDGYLLGAEGWTVGQWCSDEVMNLLNRTRDELNAMTLIEGKMIGLDFTTRKGNAFLDTWYDYSEIGVFNGDWETHRHDITAGGIIAHDMGLTLTPHLIQFAADPNSNPDVYVKAAGM